MRRIDARGQRGHGGGRNGHRGRERRRTRAGPGGAPRGATCAGRSASLALAVLALVVLAGVLGGRLAKYPVNHLDLDARQPGVGADLRGSPLVRHRLSRARPAQPGPVRAAHVDPRRPDGGGGGDALRHPRRRRHRLRGRLDRLRRHGRRRPDRHHSGARRDDGVGRLLLAADADADGDRAHAAHVDDRRPRRPLELRDAPAARVRRGRARGRRVADADRAPAPPAEQRRHDHRRRDVGVRARPRARGDGRLLQPRHEPGVRPDPREPDRRLDEVREHRPVAVVDVDDAGARARSSCSCA